MIASEEPWQRAPVVSPGALKRSASMRMQRCSISAEIAARVAEHAFFDPKSSC